MVETPSSPLFGNVTLVERCNNDPARLCHLSGASFALYIVSQGMEVGRIVLRVDGRNSTFKVSLRYKGATCTEYNVGWDTDKPSKSIS